MQKRTLSLFIILFVYITTLNSKNTLGCRPCGRMGDSIFTLAKIIYLSDKYNLDLWYTRLPFLEKFAVSSLEQSWNPQKDGTREQWEKVVNFYQERTLVKYLKSNPNNIFYTTPVGGRLETGYEFWSEGRGFHKDGRQHYIAPILEYAIEHPEYRNKLKRLLTPKKTIAKNKLPSDRISIAVHIRKGSGGDSTTLYSIQIYKYVDQGWPQKFPPDQYYLDQIKKLSNLLGNPSLYIHIFTDYRNPAELTQKYKKYLSMDNIEFGHVQKQSNPVDDLFNMMDFDCLITSFSNFGCSAQLLGKHKVCINPSHFVWNERKLIVDEVKISIPDRINHIAKQYRFDGDVLHLRDEVLTALEL